MNTDHNLKGIWAIVGFMFVVSIGISLLPAKTAVMLIRENGIIENISAMGYLIAAIWLFFKGIKNRHHASLYTGVLVVLLGLRELDFHARFTTMGIFKSRFYISPDVPLLEKSLVTIFVLLLAAGIIKYCRTYYPFFILSVREKKAWAISGVFAIAFMLLSKTIDGGFAPLEWFISLFYSDPKICIRTLEEVMEMTIPGFILLSVFKYRHSKTVD